jgi:hypothetical protein
LLDEGHARVLTLIFVSPKMIARPLFLILCVGATVAVANPPENKSSAVTSRIPRQRVQSSALASIGYSKRLHILEIEFVNGAIYRYDEIPPSVYRELIRRIRKRVTTIRILKATIDRFVFGRG